MEGLTLPCGIGFKWPRMALPCQCFVFNVLSGLVVVAKLADRGRKDQVATHRITATRFSSACSTVDRDTETHKHYAELSITTNTAIRCFTATILLSFILFSALFLHLNDAHLKKWTTTSVQNHSRVVSEVWEQNNRKRQ